MQLKVGQGPAVGEGLPERIHRLHAEGSIGTLIDLMRHKGATPLIVGGIIIVLLGGHPAEENTLAVELEGSPCVVGTAVEGIIDRCRPGPLKIPRHPIDHAMLVAVLGHDVVPPVANPEEIRHLMHGVQIRGPEITLEGPVFKVLRSEGHRPTGLPGLGPLFTGPQNQQVPVVLLIPDYPGIAPVIGIVSLLGGEGQGILGFGPAIEVVAYRMHEDLGCLTLRRVVPVVPRIEGMVAALTLEDAACIDELVLLIVTPTGDGDTAVLVVDEVLGGRQRPAERLPEGNGIAVIPLMEEEELVTLAERHAVSEPGAGELIIQFRHCALSGTTMDPKYLISASTANRGTRPLTPFKRLSNNYR